MITKITRSIIIATIILIVDSYFLSQGVIATITLFIVVFVLIPKAIYKQYKKKEYKTSYIICLIYGASALLVFFLINANNKIAHNRSEMLIAKIEQYKTDNGTYPIKLDDLIPRYIESIPTAKFSSMNKFHYSSIPDHTSLFYVAIPPFGRPIYNFEQSEWSYLD